MGVESMREGWNPHVTEMLAKAQEFGDACARFAATTSDTAVHPAVKDAANTMAGLAKGLPQKVQDVHAVTREADADHWKVADNPRPGDQAWTR